MKKLLTLALIAVLTLSLAACSSGKIKDGTYSAKSSAESNGWTDTLAVTYKDGKVVDAKYDAVNTSGALKSEMADEEYGMENPALSEWMPKLNANIISAGTADKIEVVAGATGSSNGAKALMVAVENAAKKGDTNPVLVDMPKSK